MYVKYHIALYLTVFSILVYQFGDKIFKFWIAKYLFELIKYVYGIAVFPLKSILRKSIFNYWLWYASRQTAPDCYKNSFLGS